MMSRYRLVHKQSGKYMEYDFEKYQYQDLDEVVGVEDTASWNELQENVVYKTFKMFMRIKYDIEKAKEQKCPIASNLLMEYSAIMKEIELLIKKNNNPIFEIEKV